MTVGVSLQRATVVAKRVSLQMELPLTQASLSLLTKVVSAHKTIQVRTESNLVIHKAES